MNSALAFSPRPTALGRAGAGPAALHLLSFAAIAFITSNPFVLAGCAAAVAIAGVAAGARRALGLTMRWGVALAVFVVAVNAFASQRGVTILVRGPEVPVLGTVDVSAEALAEGGVLAARILIAIAAFAILTAAVDPDRILRMIRPVARRSALTATLISRMVPLAVADRARLTEGASLRGPGAAPVGRRLVAERLVAGSLERATDAAATLELRGYGASAPRTRAARSPRAPGDRAFALAGLAALGGTTAMLLAGHAQWTAYPAVALDAGIPTLALALSLPLAALAPPAVDRLRRPAFSTGPAEAARA